MNFNDFKTKCEEFAKKMDVDVKVTYNDLSAYGMNDWWSAWFMVDHFGGNACEIAFINDNFRFTDDSVCKILSRMDDCFEMAIPAIDMMREARQGVEMINVD